MERGFTTREDYIGVLWNLLDLSINMSQTNPPSPRNGNLFSWANEAAGSPTPLSAISKHFPEQLPADDLRAIQSDMASAALVCS